MTQQTKARHKEDFVQAFSPVIADATALAYKGASSDIQTKLRRVVDVWRDRNIFERDIQDDMEARLNGNRVPGPPFFCPLLLTQLCRNR